MAQSAHASAHDEAARPAVRRPWLRRVMWALVAFPFVVLGFVALFLAWMSIAPVPLTPFAGTVERAINRALAGEAVVSIGDVALSWFPGSNRVGFLLSDVSVRDAEGMLLTHVSEANVGFALAAVLDGKLAPRRIELRHVSADLVRHADGSLSLGVARLDQAGTATDPRLAAAFLEALLAPPDPQSATTFLSVLRIREARLTFEDVATGTYLVAPAADLVLSRDAGGVKAELEAGLEMAGQLWTLSARALYRRGADRIDVEIAFPEIMLSELSSQGALFAPLGGIDVPARGTVGLAVADTGELLSLAGWLTAGAGQVRLPGGEAPFAVTAADLAFEYDVATASALLERLDLRAERISGVFGGRLSFGFAPDGEMATVAGGLTGDAVRIDWPGLFEAPVAFDRLALRGTIDRPAGRIEIANVLARRGAFEFDLSGEILDDAVSPAVTLEGRFTGLEVTELAALWPLTVGPGARDWIRENMFAGRITTAVLKADIPAGALAGDRLPDAALRLDYAFEGVEANYLAGLTHITGARGTATLLGDTFRADIDSAKVGPLAVTSGSILIEEMHKVGGLGTFKAEANGRIADVLALIDLRPLSYATRFGLDPAKVAGTARLDVTVAMPLLKDLELDQIRFDIAAKAKGLSLALDAGTRIEKGDLGFKIDGKRLRAEGRVVLRGQPLDVVWTETFEGRADTTALKVSATIDEARRAELGFDTAPYLIGPVRLTASFKGRGMDLRAGGIEADLTRALIAVPELSFRKEAGQAAEAVFDAVLARDGSLSAIDNFRLTGEGLHVAGKLAFGKGGLLRAMTLTRVRLGPRSDVTATLTREDGGALALDVSGESLDVGGLLRAAMAEDAQAPTDEAQGSPDLALALDVKRLYLREKAAIDGVRARGRLTAGEMTAFELSGRAADGGAVTLLVSTDANGAMRLRAASSDAGELLKGLTGFRSLRGGDLVLQGLWNGEGEGSATGRLSIRDFRIVDQPFLARLFAAGSLTGIADLLGGTGITFSQLDLPFERRNGRWYLAEARASGPSVGLTAEGQVGGLDGRVHVVGTLVPIYGINNMLDGIPIIGDILTGREGEGILGMTYQVRGDAEELEITVNPLSAIAPGIFRRIFEFSDAPQAQGDAPPRRQ